MGEGLSWGLVVAVEDTVLTDCTEMWMWAFLSLAAGVGVYLCIRAGCAIAKEVGWVEDIWGWFT